MKAFFNLENPVWKFIGNIADFFLLSVLWLVCSLPLVTIGASTTALYYVTLKMASNQEGYLASSFWNAFLLNLKNALAIWIVLAGILGVLFLDLYWSFHQANTFSLSLLPPFALLGIACIITLRMVFPLLARCENQVFNLIRMAFAMGIRNLLPILSTILLSAGIYSVGFFVFWPLLLIAPGLCAYLNAFIFNRILNRYHLQLGDEAVS